MSSNGRMRGLAALALSIVCTCSPVTPAVAADVPAFSGMRADSAITGWRPLRPAPRAPDTVYTLVADGGTVVLRADARASMSGLVVELRVDPREAGWLRWRWRIDAVVPHADLTRKDGDDYAARVYVLFDYPRAKLPLTTRAGLRIAEALHGVPLPTAALNYVWDNRQPVGTLRPNAYTDRARMIVVESGNAQAGVWVEEVRDVRADFRAAFGEEAPAIVGIAIATDTDNTGATAIAWYGDVELSAGEWDTSPP